MSLPQQAQHGLGIPQSRPAPTISSSETVSSGLSIPSFPMPSSIRSGDPGESLRSSEANPISIHHLVTQTPLPPQRQQEPAGDYFGQLPPEMRAPTHKRSASGRQHPENSTNVQHRHVVAEPRHACTQRTRTQWPFAVTILPVLRGTCTNSFSTTWRGKTPGSKGDGNEIGGRRVPRGPRWGSPKGRVMIRRRVLFRAKSMPKKRTHAFHFPLQVVSPVRKDAPESAPAEGRTEGCEDDAPPARYGVEEPDDSSARGICADGAGAASLVMGRGREGGARRLTM